MWPCCCSYAGQISTGAWGFNSHGVWLSLNGIPATNANSSGVARCFMHRHILGATSLDDALARATSAGIGRGFSLNLAQARRRTRVRALGKLAFGVLRGKVVWKAVLVYREYDAMI